MNVEEPQVTPLSPKAVKLRNACLGALSRRTSHRPPTPVELVKLRDDIGLRDAWTWWSKLETPTEAVRAISVYPTRRPPRRWPAIVMTILASAAWIAPLGR